MPKASLMETILSGIPRKEVKERIGKRFENLVIDEGVINWDLLFRISEKHFCERTFCHDILFIWKRLHDLGILSSEDESVDLYFICKKDSSQLIVPYSPCMFIKYEDAVVAAKAFGEIKNKQLYVAAKLKSAEIARGYNWSNSIPMEEFTEVG